MDDSRSLHSPSPEDEDEECLFLEEQFDEDYEPEPEELEEYALVIGMDPAEDADLMWIARDGLKAKLPQPWRAACRKGKEEEIFYFNMETGESTWDHPCDEEYKQMYLAEKERRRHVRQGASHNPAGSTPRDRLMQAGGLRQSNENIVGDILADTAVKFIKQSDLPLASIPVSKTPRDVVETLNDNTAADLGLDFLEGGNDYAGDSEVEDLPENPGGPTERQRTNTYDRFNTHNKVPSTQLDGSQPTQSLAQQSLAGSGSFNFGGSATSTSLQGSGAGLVGSTTTRMSPFAAFNAQKGEEMRQLQTRTTKAEVDEGTIETTTQRGPTPKPSSGTTDALLQQSVSASENDDEYFQSRPEYLQYRELTPADAAARGESPDNPLNFTLTSIASDSSDFDKVYPWASEAKEAPKRSDLSHVPQHMIPPKPPHDIRSPLPGVHQGSPTSALPVSATGGAAGSSPHDHQQSLSDVDRVVRRMLGTDYQNSANDSLSSIHQQPNMKEISGIIEMSMKQALSDSQAYERHKHQTSPQYIVGGGGGVGQDTTVPSMHQSGAHHVQPQIRQISATQHPAYDAIADILHGLEEAKILDSIDHPTVLKAMNASRLANGSDPGLSFKEYTASGEIDDFLEQTKAFLRGEGPVPVGESLQGDQRPNTALPRAVDPDGRQRPGHPLWSDPRKEPWVPLHSERGYGDLQAFTAAGYVPSRERPLYSRYWDTATNGHRDESDDDLLDPLETAMESLRFSMGRFHAVNGAVPRPTVPGPPTTIPEPVSIGGVARYRSHQRPASAGANVRQTPSLRRQAHIDRLRDQRVWLRNINHDLTTTLLSLS
eukprot:Clim_evm9s232 gene=Clim_evmTU9s232